MEGLKPENVKEPLKVYTEGTTKLSPEGTRKGMKRYELDSLVHGFMSVSSTSEWDDEMHPQINALKVGETTILKSGAYEYIKVTRSSNDVFDAEFGTYDEVYEE